jgi:hypothetical protein
MRYFAATFCLLCAVSAAMAQVVVVVRDVQPSSQNPRITVLSDGQAQPGAKLAVSDANGEQKLVRSADSHGIAVLPDVRRGKYCIVTSTSPTRRADSCLQIANGRVSKATVFSMQLVVQPPPPPTLEERLQAAAKAPVGLLTRVFTGTVQDITGAAIPRASVAVYRQEATDTAQPFKTTTDVQGQFSAVLTAGKYTVVIQSPGFETQLVMVEISPVAAQKDLNVKLNVGAIAENVAIAGIRFEPTTAI